MTATEAEPYHNEPTKRKAYICWSCSKTPAEHEYCEGRVCACYRRTENHQAMTEAGKPATAKELAERLEKARHIMMPGGEWFDTLEVEEVIKGLKALASQPEDKLKALRELRDWAIGRRTKWIELCEKDELDQNDDGAAIDDAMSVEYNEIIGEIDAKLKQEPKP